jgi:hypothetical protein
VPGYWGVGSVLAPLGESMPLAQSLFDGLSAARNVILVAGIGLALWWTRRQSTLDALLTVILTLLAVTVGFGIQWLVWPIPFALLALEERWVRWYSLAGAFMLAVHLYSLHMFPWLGEWLDPDPLAWLIRLSALPAWLITVWWTVDRYRRARAEDLALATAREQGVS